MYYRKKKENDWKHYSCKTEGHRDPQQMELQEGFSIAD